jgi:hypothetical protein
MKGSVLKSQAQVTLRNEGGKIIPTGLLRDTRHVLDCSITRKDIADAMVLNSMESRAMMTKSRGSEMDLNLLHRGLCHLEVLLTGVLLEGDKVLGNKDTPYLVRYLDE